ncbi:MAG TPA: acetate--CoA ligase family protein [Acidimicrobiales bacterium]|nr:acetate--CoA ligase family protein [Acidimicrobiales bacterium]
MLVVGQDLAERFLKADSVAIVGASERQHHTLALMKCLVGAGMDAGNIFLVSLTSPIVHGIATVPTLKDLPSKPALVVCLVSARYVSSVLTDAGELGIGAFVCVADGFADAGEAGRELQDELVEIGRRFDVAILGPNTLGYLAPGFGIGSWVGDWSAVDVPSVRDGGAVIVAQSSGMLNILLQLAAYRRIGVKAAVSVGNEAVVDAAQFIGAFSRIESVKVIGVVLESTMRPRALVSAFLEARRNGKRLWILKFGSSEIGRKNALSHSGRLASPGRIWDAIFAKLGVGIAEDFDEFLEGLGLASCFIAANYQATGALGFLTVSGGDVGLVSDLCERTCVPLAALSKETEDRLLGVEGNVTHACANPIDLGLIGHRLEVLDGIAEAIFADDQVGYVAGRLALPWKFSQRAAAMYEVLLTRSAKAKKPLVIITRGAEPLDPRWYDFFAGQNIALLTSYASGIRTIRAVTSMFEAKGHISDWMPSELPESVALGNGDDRVLGWHATQEVISRWGIKYVEAGIANQIDEVITIAKRVGFPVCVKGLVPDVIHKSNAGLVHLNISNERSLLLACEDISRQPLVTAFESDLYFEVQPMLPIACELFLGMVRDPIAGPVVTVGSGGTNVETLEDVVCILPPATEEEIIDTLHKLSIGAQLFGRFSQRQIMKFVDTVRCFASAIVEIDGHVTQVDLNPMVFTLSGEVLAIDAAVAVSNAQTGATR